MTPPEDPDTVTVEWAGVSRRRRIVFESRPAGGFWRREEVRRGDEWDPVGAEIVAGVTVAGLLDE